MTFSIEWVDTAEEPEASQLISLPFADMKIDWRGDVIVSTDWLLSAGSANKMQSDSIMTSVWLECWQQADKTKRLRLLKQGTCYQFKVWQELIKIPFGQTMTYKALAMQIGSGARAIGNACKKNPYPFIIPCHRVVAAHGLGGYSGETHGDLVAIKRELLEAESMFNYVY
ncbi:MAG: MGMT family protein [Methylicorpusculum sp.]|uniref:methylated-DNA--[protein]-cysteine S-methyltransferase n=1 Tax=Methylicorpusculum sp. TaxID=2713644 RepID=UPI00271D3E5E|nr:MGMT family protein [Methylicorpusculum sp.]MDO8845557.1 MGMT family protein [Methylicorpusculum sp.]MDO8938948.1 MGMT family protein [Methylicorpusculum sp.]MDP2179314.1 MGMT family protein [Methylicorpusculum sp.]MDP2200508.1 MGMT family protein [Methylicorpusculum sp.]MDP3530096.1 MGMT family protein [Methylicorpusculum sp.]